MAREVIEALAPHPGGLYVDATVGYGGHAESLLAACAPDGRVVGIDRDSVALEASRERLAPWGARATLEHGTFGSLRDVLDRLGHELVDGVVADLGVSSPQLDDPTRGMSFRAEGPIDMRMDTGGGETALDLIARLDEDELADVLYRYGEERRSRPIARRLKRAWDAGELRSTLDVRRACVAVLGARGGRSIDPATRTFQALRIAVNDELGELERLLHALPAILVAGGTAAIITFHSLEDRAVKLALRGDARLEPIWKKPRTASDAEIEANPRARSAKLRAARRVQP